MNLYDLRKFIDYTFETRSFVPTFDSVISPEALRVTQAIRGNERPPALFVHGILSRSGTVYVGELLRLHPELHAYPFELWEVPFLQLAGDLVKLQEKFFRIYEQNRGKIAEEDFLPLFGASMIGYLYTAATDGQRILLKVPSVRYLNRFPVMFPHEHLLVLVRDGRDLVESTLRTWPQMNFIQVCLHWNRAARMVLGANQHLSNTRPTGYWLARFEDAIADPAAFVREACARFELDVERYPFDLISGIPVQGSSTLAGRGQVRWEAVQRPQDFSPTGYWQKWGPLKKWLFNRIAGHSLVELGYGDDGGCGKQ